MSALSILVENLGVELLGGVEEVHGVMISQQYSFSYACIRLYPLDEKAYTVMLYIAGLSLRDLSERYCITMASWGEC